MALSNASKEILQDKIDSLQSKRVELFAAIEALQAKIQPLQDEKQLIIQQIQAIREDIK